jgi:hypothetical protein
MAAGVVALGLVMHLIQILLVLGVSVEQLRLLVQYQQLVEMVAEYRIKAKIW